MHATGQVHSTYMRRGDRELRVSTEGTHTHGGSAALHTYEGSSYFRLGASSHDGTAGCAQYGGGGIDFKWGDDGRSSHIIGILRIRASASTSRFSLGDVWESQALRWEADVICRRRYKS